MIRLTRLGAISLTAMILAATGAETGRLPADQLAKAAGVTLGGIVGLAEAWANTGGGPYYGPAGPIGPSTLKTAFSLTVRYGVK